MNETIYLVDNNALVALKRDRLRSAFFSSHCRVTADVLFEASGNPEIIALERSAIAITPEFLEKVRVVMETIKVGDTALVDLYGNQGAADPGLVASILEAVATDEGRLFSDSWVLVTSDHAVLAKAAEFGIATIGPDELAKLIDASPS